MLADMECTKFCAAWPEESLRWVLQSVIVDAQDFKLTIVSFLTFKSRALLALFSAVNLSERRDSIFEFRREFSAARPWSFSPNELSRLARDRPIELSSVGEQLPSEPSLESSSTLESSMKWLGISRRAFLTDAGGDSCNFLLGVLGEDSISKRLSVVIDILKIV